MDGFSVSYSKFYQDLELGWAFGAEIPAAFDSVWERIMREDGGWERSLAELASASNSVYEEKPSTLDTVRTMATSGALGVAGVALGPVGLVGAFATSYFLGQKGAEGFERALERWDGAVGRFVDATQTWSEIAQRHMEKEKFLHRVAHTARRELESLGDPEVAELVVLQMLEDLNELKPEPQRDSSHEIDFTAGIETNSCPRCGRSYPNNVVWCEICEVGL